MTDDDPNKKTTPQRLLSLEHAVFGDLVAIERYKKAAAGYVTPRGDAPLDGALVRLTRTETSHRECRDELRRLAAFLGPLEVAQAPLNGAQIATKGFVDESLQRLSNALRIELSGGGSSQLLNAEREKRLSLLERVMREHEDAMRAGFSLIARAMTKKIKKRLRDLLPSWRHGTSVESSWVLREIEDRL